MVLIRKLDGKCYNIWRSKSNKITVRNCLDWVLEKNIKLVKKDEKT